MITEIQETKPIFKKNNKSQDSLPRHLQYTRNKIQNKKELTVAFYGGSVTVGVGASDKSLCWRSLLTNWFVSQYPKLVFNAYDVSEAGTGSGYGVTRLQRDLMPLKPDLVFVEYVCNDIYQKYSPQESAYYLELLLKELLSNEPRTDVIVVLITDKGSFGTENEYTKLYKEIARHYGVLVADIGAALKKHIDEKGDKWDNYLSDWVHPLDSGHQVYFNAIRKLIIDQFSLINESYYGSLPAEPFMKRVPRHINTVYSDKLEIFENEGFIPEPETHKALWGKGSTQLCSQNKSDRLVCGFSGTGLMVDFYQNTNMCSKAIVIVDDKYQNSFCPQIDNPERQTRTLFQNLDSGKHFLELINYSGGRLEIASFTELGDF